MIGKKVTVKIDRLMGSYHPKHKDILSYKLRIHRRYYGAGWRMAGCICVGCG